MSAEKWGRSLCDELPHDKVTRSDARRAWNDVAIELSAARRRRGCVQFGTLGSRRGYRWLLHKERPEKKNSHEP